MNVVDCTDLGVRYGSSWALRECTLALPGALVLVLAVVLGLCFGSWYAHLFHVVVEPVESPWQPAFFFTTWWLLAAWTAFALALGACIGALVKRTVVAMAASAAILAGLLVAAFVFLPEMLGIGASVTTRLPMGTLLAGPINGPQQFGDPVPAGSWLVRAWLTDAHGHVLDIMQKQQVAAEYSSTAHNGSVTTWLSAHDLHGYLAYQPPGHWALQGAEGIVLFGLTLLLGFVTVRVVRGRAARSEMTIGNAAR